MGSEKSLKSTQDYVGSGTKSGCINHSAKRPELVGFEPNMDLNTLAQADSNKADLQNRMQVCA
jgi:hypothetical protein